jgi:WD40 repeat protein
MGLARHRSDLIAYDAATLGERWRLDKEERYFVDVAFSGDGRWLVLAGPDEENELGLSEPASASIRIHDVPGGAEVRRIAIDGFGVASVAFSPDGKTLVAGVGDRTIRLYDPATGEERLPRLGREGALPPRKKGERLHKGYDSACAAASLAFSPDGSLLASGVEGIGWFNHASDILPITLWDVAAAREVHKFAGHPIGTISLAFTPDGKTLASSGFEPITRIWDVATGRELDRRAGHSTSIHGLAISPADGTIFTMSLGDGPILHWNPADGRSLEDVGVYRNVINGMAIAPDGRALLLLDSDTGPLLWDVAGRKELRRLDHEKHGARLGHAAFSSDGRMVTGGYRVWEVATGRQLVSFKKDQMEWSMSSFSPDGRRVITIGWDSVTIWDIATGTELRRPIRGIPGARNAAISPDGRLVAVGQAPAPMAARKAPDPSDQVPGRLADPIRIWEMASGKEVVALFGHTDLSTGLAFSPDGRSLASVSGAWDHRGDPGLRIWDVGSGKPLRRYKDDPGSGGRMAYLPDGRSILTSNTDGLALIWDVSDLADRPPPDPPDAKALEALWSDLASDDAPRAHRASWSLSAEVAVPFLRDRLRPAAPKAPTTGPEVLRSLRAIAALERIGTPAARAVLEALARGNPDAPATQDALDALLRLSRRKTRPPGSASTS